MHFPQPGFPGSLKELFDWIFFARFELFAWVGCGGILLSALLIFGDKLVRHIVLKTKTRRRG